MRISPTILPSCTGSRGRLRRFPAIIAVCHDLGLRPNPSRLKLYHYPIIHLVFANLKTWLIGIHHGVSHQHLQAYLNEFTFRFNRRFYPFNAFRSLLGIAGDTSGPTYAELYSGEWRHPTCSGHGR